MQLRSALSAAQIALQTHPQDTSYQDDLHRTSEHLKEFEASKAEWIKARWIQDGDKCSSLFFRSFKQMSKATEISAVINDDGAILRRWEDMAKEAVAHFEKLFSHVQEENPPALQQVLDSQMKSIDAAEQELMEKTSTLSELHVATKALSKGKVPGPDGIPLEFFIQNWDIVGETLLLAILEGIENGTLHPHFTGLLVLLAKRGDLRYLINRRPLTLLNLIYKIIAKAYQLRLTAILQRFISQEHRQHS